MILDTFVEILRKSQEEGTEKSAVRDILWIIAREQESERIRIAYYKERERFNV